MTIDMARRTPRMLPDTGNRSSIFVSAGHDKRNLWWKAFRKTVLEPHAINILEHPAMEQVTEELLQLIEEMCQNLDRHEQQALEFRNAVSRGRGFGPSPIFPPDIVPPVREEDCLARCMEAIFDSKTLPPPELSLRFPLYEMPTPRPGLACGFSDRAFDTEQLRELPRWLTCVGTISDYGTGEIHPGQGIHSPFLLFERTYGHAKHEIEAAMNYCAMNGSSALNGIKLLYDEAWSSNASDRPPSPVVFSCTVDDDVGIIHHHWVDEHNTFFVAPLCKFDFRDPEHFMHFLAWVEAIEQWAIYFLLPDVKEALNIIIETKKGNIQTPRALTTPVTFEEKQDKVQRSMKLAFENIPWKDERSRRTPLGVTGAMRMRSPMVKEDMDNLTSTEDGTKTQTTEAAPTDTPMTELLRSPEAIELKLPEPQPALSPAMSSHSTQDRGPERTRSPPMLTTSTDMSAVDRSRSPASQAPSASVESLVNGKMSARQSPTIGNNAPENNRISNSAAHLVIAAPEPVLSPATSTRPLTAVNPPSAKGSAMMTSVTELKSPDGGVSVRSKKSFSGLRRDKRIRSPATPEFIGSSPKSGGGFMSKLSNAMRPKRVRTDNSGPPTPRAGEIPLPTPAYDKLRFNVLKAGDSPTSTNAYVEHILQDRVVLGEATSSQMPPPPLPSKTPGYLPLRQYATSPRQVTATTLTTGPA